MARRRRSVPALLAVAALALGGCADSGGRAIDATGTPPAATAAPAVGDGDGLRAFTGCDDLVAHVRELARPYVTARGFGHGIDSRLSGGGWTVPTTQNVFAHLGPPPRQGVLLRPSAGDRSSLTPGREQSRSYETNGRLFVSVSGGILRVLDVSGAAPTARGALDVNSAGFSPYQVLLGEHRALVLGSSNAASDGREHGLGIGVVDLTDPDHPRLESAEVVTGSMASVSIAGDVARVAVRSSPYLVFHEPAGENDLSALARNRAVIEQASVSDWLPSRRVLDAAGRPGPAAALVPCDSVRYPAADSGLAYLSVLSFDLSRPKALRSPGAAAVLADTGLLYGTPDRLYVATYPGAWGREPDESEVPSTVTRSVLHEFEAAGAGPARYTASGGVAGWVPGEWGLSKEKDGLLVLVDNGRIADSTVRRSIVLMQRQGTRLREVRRYSDVDREGYKLGWFGPVAGIAQGRDPALGVVRVEGRGGPASRATLEVPGFSDFLAAPDRDHLIAVGEGPAAGGALRVSAFDIGDLAAPRRTDLLALEAGSRSQAEEDAGFTLYLPGHRNLVLPVLLPVGKQWRRALVGVHVAKDGTLSESGRWLGHLSSERARSRDVDFVEVVGLPDGRLVALERNRATLLSGSDLSVRGSTAYPRPA